MGPRHRLLARELASPCPSTRAGRKIDLYEACAVDGRSARAGASGLYDLAEAVARGPQATDQSLEGNSRARSHLITGEVGYLSRDALIGNRCAFRPSRAP